MDWDIMTTVNELVERDQQTRASTIDEVIEYLTNIADARDEYEPEVGKIVRGCADAIKMKFKTLSSFQKLVNEVEKDGPLTANVLASRISPPEK